jgi:hypothetical protein
VAPRIRLVVRNPTLTGESSMTTREAARPLRRYTRARVRAASLAPTYTITRDVTRATDNTSLI